MLYLVLLCLATGSAVPLGPMDKIKTAETQNLFVDGYGRVRLFHGVNAVVKEFPWYPEYLLSEQMLDDLQDWGLNIVRLGSMWSGAEPIEGLYNQTYMDQLHAIVQGLAERGIYAFLDMHQDCFTAIYYGVPEWLEAMYPPQEHEYPWPLDSIDFWEENYLTEQVSTNFQYFYDNYAQSITRWGDLWQEFARQFKSYPSVIGYNLINEPWAGNYLEDPLLLLPGVAGSRNLLPRYNDINSRIREVDTEGLVLYEPVLYGQVGDGGVLGSGFDQVPGGPHYRNVSAYSFHMYCWLTEFVSPDANDTEKQAAVDRCDNELLPKMIQSALDNVNTIGGAAMLTEFGLCKTWEDTINVKCQTFMDLCDDNMMSWVEWGYPSEWYYSDGLPRWGKVEAYLRAYARAVAGTPSLHKYNDQTRTFTLQYLANTGIAQPTEIYVPPRKYPTGYDITINPSHMTYDITGSYVYIYNAALMEDQQVVVVISPQ